MSARRDELEREVLDLERGERRLERELQELERETLGLGRKELELEQDALELQPESLDLRSKNQVLRSKVLELERQELDFDRKLLERQGEALFSRLIRQLSALKSQDLRAQTLAREVEHWGSALLTQITSLALQQARSLSSAADLVNTLAHALERRLLDEEVVAQARQMARSKPDRLSEALFASGPAAREYDVNDETFVDHQIRALALGRRRSLGRLNDRFLLTRLLHDTDPVVIGHLLANPRITETDALVVASRRPTRPPVLESVLCSRFSTSLRVRRAVSQNPYATVSQAVRAMATLDAQGLRQVLADGQVSDEIRSHARSFLVARGVRPAERHAAKAPKMAKEDSEELARLVEELEGEVGEVRFELLDVEED